MSWTDYTLTMAEILAWPGTVCFVALVIGAMISTSRKDD